MLRAACFSRGTLAIRGEREGDESTTADTETDRQENRGVLVPLPQNSVRDARTVCPAIPRWARSDPHVPPPTAANKIAPPRHQPTLSCMSRGCWHQMPPNPPNFIPPSFSPFLVVLLTVASFKGAHSSTKGDRCEIDTTASLGLVRQGPTVTITSNVKDECPTSSK